MPRRTLALPAPPAPPSRTPVRLPGLSTVPPSSTAADSDTTCSTCSTVPDPLRLPELSTVPPRLTIYSNRVGLEPSLPLTRLPNTKPPDCLYSVSCSLRNVFDFLRYIVRLYVHRILNRITISYYTYSSVTCAVLLWRGSGTGCALGAWHHI